MKLILLPLLIIISVNANSNYRLIKGTVEKTNLGVGAVVKFHGSHKDANDISVSTSTKSALELNSKFDCNTGDISVDASFLDIPAELDKQMKEIFGSANSILSNLAYQEATEFLLNRMAIIHFNMTKKTGGKSLSAFAGLSAMYTAKCIKATIGKSFETSLEGGLGFNVYDLFSGKFGVNAAELMTITKCLRNGDFDSMDDKDKERFEKSKKYVRHLFYKILNESLDIDVSNHTTVCKEFDTKKSKRDEIGYNLACKGVFVDLMGNKTQVSITGKKVPVGVKKTSFTENSEKESKREEMAKEDTDNVNDDSENNKSLLNTSKIKYEAILTKTAKFTKTKDVIDILDFSNDEKTMFNLAIFKEASNLINKSPTQSKKVKIYTIEILRRLFTIQKLDKNIEKEYLCAYIDSSEKNCKKDFFPDLTFTTYSDLRNEVKKRYESKLKERALSYNFLSTGLVDFEDLNSIKEDYIRLHGSGEELDSYKNYILKKQKEKLDIWKQKKDFLFAGSEMIFIDRYNFYNKDVSKIYEYINNNTNKINNAIIMLKPLHELETARLLFNFSNSNILPKIILAKKTISKSYIIGRDPEDIKNNFKYLDNDQNFILSQSSKSFYGLTTNDLKLIRKNIGLAKDIYITTYINTLLKRLESLRSWLYNFQKKGYTQNAGMTAMQKLEINKVMLKIEQRKKILSLFK